MSGRFTIAVSRVMVALVVLVAFAPLALAQDLTVYDDALRNGFQDWSWAVHDLATTDPVAEGSYSISMEPDGWAGLYLHRDSPIDAARYPKVRLWIHGGPSGGQLLRLVLQLDGLLRGDLALGPAPANSWEQRTLDLDAMGLTSGAYNELIVQDATGTDQATVYLDHIELIETTEPPPPPEPVAVLVEPAADRHAISPLIYGVNFGEAAQLADPGFPLRRRGGNSTTRYNWRTDVHNTASDWFFMNIPDAVADPGALPSGSGADVFVDESLAAGAVPILTATTIGWAPHDERVKMWSYSQAAYGPQLLDECSYFGGSPPGWCTADAGDGSCDPAVNTTGYCSTGGLIVGNDPADTSQPIDPSWITDWMLHLASWAGTASQGGPRLWALDNEPMLWSSTHRDVHPTPLTYDGLWSTTVDYGSAIKAQDPDAEVLGPVVWGWCAFFTSAADATVGTCVDGADRDAHGGLPLLEWYLDHVCAYERAHGVRLVDYLDVHYYPQGTVSGLDDASSSEDPTTSARRLRSVKELYDPTYTSESWIGEPVYLIPRLRAWIDARCPGTGLAITEYRWGADDGPSSALAQAEVLAVFGREGVDLAARWVAPEPGSRTEDAFRLFLDYDGAGAQVDGDSVRATSTDVDAVGAYAVRGPDDELWLLLFNKDVAARTAVVTVTGGLVGTAQVYRFDGANPLALVESFVPGREGFSRELPARSATLVVAAVPGELIFSDDFESGGPGEWSSAVP